MIINAVMNCSFLQNSHIQAAVYDNRLEITSPGGLMPGVTLERMKEGYSKIRNRALAHTFSYMNLIEAWGSGIPKLMIAMQEYGLREPEFIDMEIAFRINLYRMAEEECLSVLKTDQDTDQANQSTDRIKEIWSEAELTDKEKAILMLIKKQPYMTQKELASQLGWTISSVKYYMTKLKGQHILKRQGNNQNGQWEILIQKSV